jgi:hypothetical protein
MEPITMLKRICVAAALSGPLLVSAAAGHAANSHAAEFHSHRPVNEGGDQRACVTLEEFLAWNLHMPEHRVQRVFDTNGRRVSHRDLNRILHDLYLEDVRRDSIVRAYPICEGQTAGTGSGRVLVEFTRRTALHRSIHATYDL